MTEEEAASLELGIEQIIAATNDQTDPTNDAPGDVVTTVDPKEGEPEKKGLPVCK